MFIKLKYFKTMIKQAYKGVGLTVGRRDDRLFFAGSYWVIDVHRQALSNKALAAVIELTGELPADGEVFKATDAGNQYEIPENSVWDVVQQAKEADIHYTVTSVILQDWRRSDRVLQSESGKVQLINNMFIDAVDIAEMTFAYESYLEGPVATGEESKAVYWESEGCVLAAWLKCIDGEEEEEFVEYLQGVQIPE